MVSYLEIDRLAVAIDRIDDQEQKAVWMHYLGQYSNEQIAERLGVSIDEAHLLAIRGLQQVKANFIRK
jgi:DNA-directed RNA polymerase specialized sigma24 family protein